MSRRYLGYISVLYLGGYISALYLGDISAGDMILLGLIAAGAFGYFETFDTPLKRTALDAARDISAGIDDDPVTI